MGLLLRHIQLRFKVWEADKAFSRTLVEGLRAMKSPPWLELLKGKPLTEVTLAQQLRTVGVKTRTVWINGATSRGYHLGDFEDAFARYVAVEDSGMPQARSGRTTTEPSAA